MAVRYLNRAATEPDAVEFEAGQPDIKYYYDYHPTKEELMAESPLQFDLMHYLVSLLRWLYRDEGWFVAGNLNIYQTPDPLEYPLAPDVAFFKGKVMGQEEQDKLRSWRTWQPNHPVPTVVIEIASDSTWREDLQLKPDQYYDMGVKEYFAYDPHQPGIWRVNRKPTNVRLRGWKYERETLTELPANPQGWLWSEQLDKWLVPDGRMLRIYTPDGERCLDELESQQVETQRLFQLQAQTQQQLVGERTAKEAERAAMALLLEKLKAKGIDPNTL